MKKKEIKKTKLKPRKKAVAKKDQLVVILEDMCYEFSVMKEGFSGVNKRFDNLDKKIDNNHKEFLEFRGVMIGFKNEMTDFRSDMTDFKNEMTDFKNEMIDFKKGTNNNFKTLFKFRNETNDNFKVNFEYLSKIDDELQWMKIEIADLKIIFKDRVELKKIMKMERQIFAMQEQVDTLMMA